MKISTAEFGFSGVAAALLVRIDTADAAEVMLRRARVPLVKAELVRAFDNP